MKMKVGEDFFPRVYGFQILFLVHLDVSQWVSMWFFFGGARVC